MDSRRTSAHDQPVPRVTDKPLLYPLVLLFTRYLAKQNTMSRSQKTLAQPSLNGTGETYASVVADGKAKKSLRVEEEVRFFVLSVHFRSTHLFPFCLRADRLIAWLLCLIPLQQRQQGYTLCLHPTDIMVRCVSSFLIFIRRHTR